MSMARGFKFRNPGKLMDGDLELILINKTTAPPAPKRSPCYVFEMRQSSDGTKVETIRLRIDSTAALRLPGPLGFDVKPKFRGHRYAARSCRLSLGSAHGLSSVWIICDPKNAASIRSCEWAGGRYVETVRIPKNHEMYTKNDRFLRRYRIDLRKQTQKP